MKLVPILAPLIDVTDHIVEPIFVGRVAHDSCRVGAEEIGLGTFDVLAGWIEALFEATGGGDFPLGFGGEPFANPFRIGRRAIPGDADDRVLGIARLDAEFPSEPFDSRVAQADDVEVVRIFSPPIASRKRTNCSLVTGLMSIAKLERATLCWGDSSRAPWLLPRLKVPPSMTIISVSIGSISVGVFFWWWYLATVVSIWNTEAGSESYSGRWISRGRRTGFGASASARAPSGSRCSWGLPDCSSGLQR